ncbi:hypothetical protein A33Q_2093 [Indibacter alkaliphilus LW1]|jgi:hypothetical protein|uniref:DUF3575 domain-containing protein n=1 Tax=Indibacter alkaliphilus (strain CCUG 57479 / KCTC 22604 / LW1) TaxID=1189612 RepID=S2E3K9_INDAL|nr:hypothetical protein [Indibacter alkaliphilus]EOZ96783.1 hypothetical protein A33Q_2093 [Indibacter alkaliphilus LW1]
MKKIVIAIVALVILQNPLKAQTSLENPRGEVRLNFLNTILLGSVEVGYEQFIANDQSIGVELHLNDRFGYRRAGDARDFSATSFLLSYNFYFAGDDRGKIHVSPFFKYRFGEYTEAIDSSITVTSLNSGQIGLMSGYRWNYNNFAFGPFAAISRVFSQEVANTFSAIEFKAGFNVGYRF